MEGIIKGRCVPPTPFATIFFYHHHLRFETQESSFIGVKKKLMQYCNYSRRWCSFV